MSQEDFDLSFEPEPVMERNAEMDMPLRNVRPNIVQSIRAFRVQDLQEAATALGHHFLYANLGRPRASRTCWT